RDGSKAGTHVENVIPKDTSSSDQVPVLAAQVEKQRVAINTTWLMLGGILVLFMQAGFALVETGFTRAKNAAHTMMMNMVIFALGVVGWFVCGYALMFGAADQSKILGLTPLGSPWHIGSWNVLAHTGFFLGGHAYDVSVLGFFFFQLVFMDATATIPTGAMAAVWGAKILGPRLGKFDKDGNPRAIPGHHLPMAILGTFILLVGWMGFNGGSTFAGTDLRLTVVITNTILASAFGCLSAM